MMDGNVRQVSRALYQVLETVGASVKIRHLARNRAVTNEILATVLDRDNCIYLYCGSRFEGTFTYDMESDIDLVWYSMADDVVISPCEVKQLKSYLVVHDQCNHPGYVKMQLLLEGEPQTISTNGSFKPDGKYELDCTGRICQKYDHQGKDKQGPSIPVIDAGQNAIADRVFSLFLGKIPEFAKDWLRRTRSYDWPTGPCLDEMKDMGCLAVHVGHEWSAENTVEWRLSFTLQERFLMSSLNAVQHKVYVLLKIIKNEFIKPKFANAVLTSYQCKTCVLYMAETTPSKNWREDNIVNCVMLCLKTLLRWVNTRFCPNFFLKDQNLFAKTVFRKHSKIVSRVLKDLLDLGYQMFYILHTERIWSMLTSEGYRKYIDATELRVSVQIVLLTSHYLIAKANCQLLRLLETPRKREHMFSFLEHLKNIRTIPCHKASETQDAISILIPWLHFYLARTILCESITDSAASSNGYALADANYHFSFVLQAGQVPVRFSVAAYLYTIRKYVECYSLLKYIEHDLVDSIVICVCSNQYQCKMPKGLVSFCYKQPAETLVKKIVNCEIFHPSEINITPTALQVEMGRSIGVSAGFREPCLQEVINSAIVDPFCCLRFMQYLVGLALNKSAYKQHALTQLEMTAKDDCGHQETAYNLLGWAYIQETRIGDAIRCFVESWKLRPNHNAAKFHMNSMSNVLFKMVCHWHHTKNYVVLHQS